MAIPAAFKKPTDPRIFLHPSLALAICLALLGVALVVPMISAGAGSWMTEPPPGAGGWMADPADNNHNERVMGLSQLGPAKVLFIHDGTGVWSSIYNTDWNGYSYFADEVLIAAEAGIQAVEMNITTITSSALEPYALVIFSPWWGGGRELSEMEAAAVADYVFQGGNLLLLGEYGFVAGAEVWLSSTNKIGQHFGIQFRFVMVCDPTDHYDFSGNPDPDASVDQPLISSLIAHEVTAGVSPFFLNWASCMSVSPPAVAIAYTDADAWLETNPVWHPELGLIGLWECYRDPLEEVGAFPVLAVAEYGEGRVVAVGDTSWLCNEWVHYGDAETLAYNVASWLLSGVYEHTASTPVTPSGPSSGQTGESLEFSTGGATCSQGHPVQYRFDWGDGSYSNWSSSTSASHIYSSTSTYQVKAQARCASDTSVVSGWSSIKSVTISATPPAHTVSTPNTPSGPSSGGVGESLPFSTGGSTCSQGHPVQYRFDWGNGNYSSWSSSASASYSYSSTGTYQVTAQARCADDYSVMSNRSVSKAVSITAESKFKKGETVRATKQRNIRNDENEVIGTVSAGYGGIIEGSSRVREVNGVEYMFWKIDWKWKLTQNGADIPLDEAERKVGWTAEGSSTADWLLTDDVYWLAKVITNEAGAYYLNTTERQAVGYTVLSRLARENRFHAESIHQVALGGYTPNWGKPHKEPTDANIVGIAEGLLGVNPPDDPTYGADHFFSPVSQATTASGLRPVPGTDKSSYYPKWAKPYGKKGWTLLTKETKSYITVAGDGKTKDLQWTQLGNIRNKYFMFYKPYKKELVAELGSAAELRIIDSEGRITGLMDGAVITDIPGSVYVSNSITIPYPFGSYIYEVKGIHEGAYELTVTVRTTDADIDFLATNMRTSAKSLHQYTINWEALERGEVGTTLQMDNNGDGSFEETLEVGPELDGADLPDGGEDKITLACGPNPVGNSGVTFFYNLPPGTTNAKILVFNVSGRLLSELLLDVNGSHFPTTGRWNPVDRTGQDLGNGPYLYVLVANGKVVSQGKMVIQR